MNGGECPTKCGDGKYPDTASTSCKPCEDTGCNACSAAGKKQCTSCLANFFLDAGECATCGDGKYSAAGSKVSTDCKACTDTGCKTCSGSGIGVCTACLADYYLSGGKCVKCADGKYSAAGSTKSTDCKACADLGCKTCSSSGSKSCTKCKANFYLNVNLCTACPDGQYSPAESIASTACQNCNDPTGCKVCNGGDAKKCTSCKANYYLSGGECKACDAGKYSLAGAAVCLCNLLIEFLSGLNLFRL